MHINRVTLMGQVSTGILRAGAYALFGLTVDRDRIAIYVYDRKVMDRVLDNLVEGAIVQVDGRLIQQGGVTYVGVMAEGPCDVRVVSEATSGATVDADTLASIATVAGTPRLADAPEGARPAERATTPAPVAANVPEPPAASPSTRPGEGGAGSNTGTTPPARRMTVAPAPEPREVEGGQAVQPTPMRQPPARPAPSRMGANPTPQAATRQAGISGLKSTMQDDAELLGDIPF